MPTIIKHRKVKIVVMGEGEVVQAHCRAGDIALVNQDGGWWTQFVGEAGHVDGYDQPFPSYNEALWAAKAAAEFGLD